MQRAKSDEERWRTEKHLSWDPDMRLGVIQQAQQMHAMWALKLQQYNDLFQEALIEALQDFKHKQVKPSNAFTELPDDMIDSVLEKLDEGESDARKMIQGLKDTLKRKQKQLRQYKAELTELEDIRQVTAWDGLEQNLEQVKNRINRRTKELEALEEDYDERKRQFSHHFSPEKRKIWKKLHHSDRTVTPSRAYADLPAELKGRIEAEALELKRADARQAPVFPNGTRISFDMARRTNRETGHEGVVQDYNFGHYRILRDSGNVWIMRPGDDIVNIEMVSASQVATHLPLGSRVMFSNDDRRSLNYALATVDDTNSQEATTERDQEGEIVNFYRGVYTICDNANRVSYLRQNDVSPVPRAPRNVSASETCPLCLDDDAEEIALCENLGDFVNAEGERQGHGVCNTCLPAYLATGRDNCLICRTPYGERWQAVRQNYLPEPDPWIREMQDHMAQNSDDSDVSLPYDDDSSSSDDDGPAVPFYGSRPTTRIPVFRRNQAPQLFREGFAGAYTQEDNGGFDLIEDRDNVRQFPDPFEIGSSVWASENSIYTELSRHIPDHARLPSNERYIGLGWVVNAWREGSEVDEDESTWWYTIEWDLSWVSATQPVYIRTDHPRAHLQMEQPRSFARDWVREVPSFHIDVEFKVDGFTPAFDVLSGMTRWETIYCRVIRKMPILGNTNQLVALSREDGTFIQYKLVRSVDIFRGCELERFQFKPHVWPDT